MKLEKLDYNGSKGYKMFLYGLFVGVLLLVIVGLLTSKAKYKQVDKVNLINQRIQYTGVDLEIVEIKVDGDPSDKIPEGNYDLTEDSYCTEKDAEFNDKKNEKITLSYDSNTKAISITPYTNRGTKCHLFFIKGKTASEKTMDKLGLGTDHGTVASFTGPSCGTGCGDDTNKNMNQNGIYQATDDYGTSYYFRGTVSNNWVKFANLYWRIVRINGNGTIRLIYNGAGTGTTDASTVYKTGIAFNTSYNNNAYVGLMYGSTSAGNYANTHKNEHESTILGTLKEFYNSISTTYGKYLDGETGFCGDRTINTEPKKWWTSDTALGYGTNATAYVGFSRFLTSSNSWKTTDPQTPSLVCTNPSNDLYTTADAQGKGNGKLPVPVGLITADEVVYAGGFGGKSNSGYYLYNNQNYWTMSPCYWYSIANVFSVRSDGYLTYSAVYGTSGVRPVINLKADTTFRFDKADQAKGTADNPYIVVETP